MKTIRRTKIRFEKHELKIVRIIGGTKMFCENCQTETEHFTISQAAALQNLSESRIFYLAESGQIHFNQTADEKLMICADSIKIYD